MYFLYVFRSLILITLPLLGGVARSAGVVFVGATTLSPCDMWSPVFSFLR